MCVYTTRSTCSICVCLATSKDGVKVGATNALNRAAPSTVNRTRLTRGKLTTQWAASIARTPVSLALPRRTTPPQPAERHQGADRQHRRHKVKQDVARIKHAIRQQRLDAFVE